MTKEYIPRCHGHGIEAFTYRVSFIPKWIHTYIYININKYIYIYIQVEFKSY